MKKIGIVGGIGWPSTVEYYRLICEASQNYHEGASFSGPVPMPEISIESLNMNFTVNNRGSAIIGSWDRWDEYFKAAITRLVKSGCELILLASVTPHARLKEISQGVSVPILSIYECIGAYCNFNEIKNLLVLGTMPTMTSLAFKNGMEKFGINTFYPPTEQLKEKIVGIIEQLYQNKLDGAALVIDKLVRSCIPSDSLESTSVCLACTELPLAFDAFNGNSGFDYQGISYLNSTVVHASSAFEYCTQ